MFVEEPGSYFESTNFELHSLNDKIIAKLSEDLKKAISMKKRKDVSFVRQVRV